MMLVTGATGFVGRGLLSHLAAHGVDARPASRMPMPGSVRVGEIGPGTDWSQALAGVDTVVHLAARVHVMRETATNPDSAFDHVNVHGTLNLAQQAVAAGVRRLVYISSIKVNGEATAPGQPFCADDVAGPVDPYGRSKWKAEQALRRLAAETGLQLVIIRPPLVYGPGVGGNFSALIRLVDRGVPLPFGLLDNRRSMVGLDNLHDLILAAARHPDAPGRVFLVSDDRDISTRILVQTIGRALGRPPLLLPVPPGFMRGTASLLGKTAVAQRLLSSLQVDIEATKAVLGWRPVSSLDQGVAQAVDHYRRARD